MEMFKGTRVPYSRYREIMNMRKKLLYKKETDEEQEQDQEDDEEEEEEVEEEETFDDDFKLDVEEESISTRTGNLQKEIHQIKKRRLGSPSDSSFNKRHKSVDPHEACRTTILILKKKLNQKTLESLEYSRKCMENYKYIQSRNKSIKNLRFLNEELQATVINGFDAIKDIIQNKKNAEEAKEVINTVDSKTATAKPKSDVELKVGALSTDQKMFHMGRGIYIPVEVYIKAKIQTRSNPYFVKIIALSLFGKQTLLKSSVTGKGSNRNGCKKLPELSLESAKLLAIKDTYCYWLQTEKKMDIENAEIESCRVFSYISKQISDMKMIFQSKNAEIDDNHGDIDYDGTEESEEEDNQNFSTYFTGNKIKIETAAGPSEIKLENLENEDCIEVDNEDFRDFNDPL